MLKKWIIAITLPLALLGVFLARGPDFELELRRQTVSLDPYAQVIARIDTLDTWKEWGHWLVRAEPVVPEVLSSTAQLNTPIPHVGQKIRLVFEPKGRASRRSERILRVVDLHSDPQSGLHLVLAMESESRAKLSSLLSNLVWEIDIKPQPSGLAQISTQYSARTSGAKGRLFSRLVPEVLLHQSFFGNVDLLAGRKPAEGLSITP